MNTNASVKWGALLGAFLLFASSVNASIVGYLVHDFGGLSIGSLGVQFERESPPGSWNGTGGYSGGNPASWFTLESVAGNYRVAVYRSGVLCGVSSVGVAVGATGEGSWSGTAVWSASFVCTVTGSFSGGGFVPTPPPCEYKAVKATVRNNGTAAQDYALVYYTPETGYKALTGQVSTVLPGQSATLLQGTAISDQWETLGGAVWAVVRYDDNAASTGGAVVHRVGTLPADSWDCCEDGECDPAGEFVDGGLDLNGEPVEDTTITPPVDEAGPDVRKDVDSKEPEKQSIDFATGVTDAKDETLKTGFSSVKNSVTTVGQVLERGFSKEYQEGQARSYAADGTEGDGSAAAMADFNEDMAPRFRGVANLASNVLTHFSGVLDRDNATGGGTLEAFGSAWDFTWNPSSSGSTAAAWVRCVTLMVLVMILGVFMSDEIMAAYRGVMATAQTRAPDLATPGAWFGFMGVYLLLLAGFMVAFYAGAGNVLDGILGEGYVCGLEIPASVRWFMGQVDKVFDVEAAITLGVMFLFGKQIVRISAGLAMVANKAMMS